MTRSVRTCSSEEGAVEVEGAAGGEDPRLPVVIIVLLCHGVIIIIIIIISNNVKFLQSSPCRSMENPLTLTARQTSSKQDHGPRILFVAMFI